MTDDAPPALIEAREHARRRAEAMRVVERNCRTEEHLRAARLRAIREEDRYNALLGESRDGRPVK